MKKLFFALALVLCLASPSWADFMGATITGSCGSNGPVASAADMKLLYTSIATQHTAWANKVVEAIMAGTKAEEAASAQNTKADLQAQAAQERNRINAEAKIASANRNIFDTPVDNCQTDNVGYYFNMYEIAKQESIGRAVAAQRDMASGLTEDMNQRDLALGNMAKFFDKHGFLFPAPVYTEKQYQAAGDAFDLLLPDWKNPRPKNLKAGGVEEARYMVAEARVRILRSVLADAWYNFTSERAPVIPAEEIYKFIGPNENTYTMMDYSSVVDPKTGLTLGKQPVTVNIDPKGNVSPMVLYDAVFKHFSNPTWLAEVGGKGAAAVLKEDLMLHAYEFRLLNDIRKDVQTGNLLKSLALLKYYGNLVDLTENQIAK